MLRCSPWSLAVLALTATAVHADNWPQWRGPANDGHSTAKNVPTAWGPEKNIVWKFKMPGYGSSTPAIWGDMLFVTAEEDKTIVLFCIGTDGKERWKRAVGTVPGKGKFMSEENNGATPSPSTDGQHVYVIVGSGEFACFDFKGNEVWKFNAQDRYGKFKYQFGMHTTPVLDNGKLYTMFIHSKPAVVVSVDAKTGADVWKIERPSDGRAECEHSYASPVIWRKGEQALLLVHGNDYCTAHNLTDGKEVWRLGGLNPKMSYDPTLRFVASPLATPDLIVVPTAKKGPVVAVKPTAMGEFATGSQHEAWRYGTTPDVPSPLLVGDLLFLCREKDQLMCLDAKTGKLHFQERIHESRFRASPVYADGHVYLTARDGTVIVVKAEPKLTVVAKNKLSDITAASPAIVGGRIFLHGYEYLYAIGLAQ